MNKIYENPSLQNNTNFWFRVESKKISDNTQISIYQNDILEHKKTLIVAHWFFRNGDFYSEVIKNILSQWTYDRVISFDFPWHDNGNSDISFPQSIQKLTEVIDYIKSNYDSSINIWWHSYGWLVATHLINNNPHLNQKWNNNIDQLFLSSLPVSMKVNDILHKIATKAIWQKKHQEIYRWLKNKKIFSKYINNGNIILWDLTITDWGDFLHQYKQIPSLDNIGKIIVSTTQIRARVDTVLWLVSIQEPNDPLYFSAIPPNNLNLASKSERYNSLTNKFIHGTTKVIASTGHWIGVPETHKRTPDKWRSPIKQLIQTICSE